MACEDIRAALASLSGCEETDQGSRVTTQCMYPSFDPVAVYVVGYGDGFKVHDGGGAIRAGWDHARDAHLVRRMLVRQAAAYHLKMVDDSLVVEVPSKDWLASAIVAVANASASAAHSAVASAVNAAEAALKDRIYQILSETVPVPRIRRAYELAGASGKLHSFDFGVQREHDGWLVLDAVAPHHVSISSRYVAFSDTREASSSIIGRFAG